MKKLLLLTTFCLTSFLAVGQGTYSMKDCIEYAVANNQSLQKDRLALEAAAASKQEVIGALLPQISGSGSFTDNIDKTTIAMPNFVNSMMPEAMRDPNAPKYMSVTMGMDLSASWGASVAQQIINFSLFNAVGIANAGKEMARLGVEMTENDVIAQTATLYYNVQVMDYALSQFDSSLELMGRTLNILKVNKENGLMRQVDVDRVQVAKTNLETQRGSMALALELQTQLLKLQMGFPINDNLVIAPINPDEMEFIVSSEIHPEFELEGLLPYKMLKTQQKMLKSQLNSAISANLPVVALVGNYSMNYMGDDFKGETYHKFPVSMISLSMKVPLFSGLSNSAKVKKARIELKKAEKDENDLVQALSMNYSTAHRQLDQQLKTIESQKRNINLAQEVYNVTELNFNEGISSLSDLLNASSSLIEAQMNYVDALNSCMKAYIDLKKADGTINDLIIK